MGTRPIRRTFVSGLAATALLALVGCDLGAPPTTYAAPGNVVAVVDVQGDGHLDVVTWSPTEYGILTNDGTGAFTVTTTAHTPCYIGMSPDEFSNCSVTFADANADGAVDMLVTLVSDISPPPLDPLMHTDVRVSLNDGSGTFGAWTSVAGADGDRDGRITSPVATVGDVTGDGIVDIVFTDFPFLPVRRIQVLPGDGTGSFGPAVVSTNPPPFNDSYPQVVDLDADGNGDLLFDGSCWEALPGGEFSIRGCVDVMFGDGSGTFAPGSRSFVDDPAVGRSVAHVGDVDSDGDLDVVSADTVDGFSGRDSVGSLTVFLNDGAGALGPGISRPATTQTVGAMLGEFDGDGHPDLLTTTSGTADGKDWHHVIFGDGTGAFSGNHLLPAGPGQVGDFDGDGRSDVVVTTPAGTQVFLNRWNGRPG